MSKRDWSKIVNEPMSTIVGQTGEWRRSKKFETGWGNFAEKLMLIVSEAVEVLEARGNIEAYSKMILFFKVGDIQETAEALQSHLKNYIEEWVDIMVRTIELIEACGLSIDESALSADMLLSGIKPSFLVDGRVSLDMLLQSIDGRFQTVVTNASRAMEAFRDVKLETIDDDIVPLNDTRSKEAVEEINRRLGRIVISCIRAIRDIGEKWPECYAEKMTKNEQRAERHGHER